MNEEINNFRLSNQSIQNFKLIFQFWNIIFFMIGLIILTSTAITLGTASNGMISLNTTIEKFWFNISILLYNFIIVIVYFVMLLVLLTYINNNFENPNDSISLNSNRIVKILLIVIGWNFFFIFSQLYFNDFSIFVTLQLVYGIILMNRILSNTDLEIRKIFVLSKWFVYILGLLLVIASYLIWNVFLPASGDTFNQFIALDILTGLIYIVAGVIFFLVTNYKLKISQNPLTE